MLRQYMKHIKSIHLAQEASQSKNPKLGNFSISHLVVILYDRVHNLRTIVVPTNTFLIMS